MCLETNCMCQYPKVKIFDSPEFSVLIVTSFERLYSNMTTASFGRYVCHFGVPFRSVEYILK